MKKIYLDHASTTPTDPDIVRRVIPFMSKEYSNPSSMHESGRRAKAVIEESRARIAKVLGCTASEIIFTGSGTEADNLALIGIARAHREHGNHIIISAIEHKAVFEATNVLKKEGFEISILPVDDFGVIDIVECLTLIKKETILISVMYANNEIGTIEPIKELAHAVEHCRGTSMYPLFHTDACQAAGYLPLNPDDLAVDLMTLNSSKIYGPKGVGMLYVRCGVRISPVIVGGDQEKGLRAGTENIALIYGFALALEKVERNRGIESLRVARLRDYFLKRLENKIPHLRLNGHPTKRLPNNIHISIPAVEGESMLLLLDEKGIEASTGSACSSFDLKPSHVLLAIRQHEEIIHGSIRFTLGKSTTKSDIDYVLKVFPAIVEHLTLLSAVTTYHEQKII